MLENPGDAAACSGRDPAADAVHEADREATFARLVLSQRTRMLRSIWRVVRDADAAEDALQDALAVLWRRLPTLARHPNPEALVLRVCLNSAYDQLRARSRHSRHLVALDGEDLAAVARCDPSFDQKMLLDEVLGAIGRLRRPQATAILLRALRGESYESIGRVLGCSEITARVHVLRAREGLRRLLSHVWKTSPGEAAR